MFHADRRPEVYINLSVAAQRNKLACCVLENHAAVASVVGSVQVRLGIFMQQFQCGAIAPFTPTTSIQTET